MFAPFAGGNANQRLGKIEAREGRNGQIVATGLTMAGVQSADPATRNIFGVRVADMARADALAVLHRAIDERRHTRLAFCNAHTANIAWSDAAFRNALETFLVLPDGFGVDIAARWLSGAPFAANLNGTDFTPELLTSAQKPLRVAMIGGRPGMAARAASALRALDGRHEFGPVLDGFAEESAVSAWLASLENRPADIILVAMGNPKQEFWIATRLAARHGVLAIGVGALFDFLAGDVRRAPPMLRKLRLEWVWRLALEPQRLFRRYVLGNPLFLMRLLALKLGIARR
jgi:exopolysaccharide biosynthesis WecB/TagA/CpsF family protein